jgi:hypothetical protein
LKKDQRFKRDDVFFERKIMKTVSTSKSLMAGILISLSMLLGACGSGTDGRNIQIPGVDGPTVTLNQDNVLISLVFENLTLDGGIRYAIPRYPNSYIEVSPDLLSSGTLMSISLKINDVFNGGLQQLPAQYLPGGRALPGVASGRLPAVAFSIEKFNNMAFYVGPQVFGVFVPVSNLGIGNSIATFRYFTEGSRSGNLSLVGQDSNGENSGILLMLDMSTSVKRRLNTVAKRYN